MTRPTFNPYRPTLISLVNWLGRLLEKVGIRASLDEESLLAAARRKTGLVQFGDESFRPALRILLQALEQEARLHPVGRFILRTRLVDMLGVRLGVEDLLSRHPEILQQEIRAPIVIAGLQRTGTTMLHRLLAADPDTRALLSWEAINPVPDPKQQSGKPDRRIKAAVLAEKALAYLSPEFFAIHPVEATAPEEDILLMDFSFMSTVAEAMVRVPTYAAWLKQQDMTPVYRYVKVLLQLLQWQRPGKRWVLKTPAHLAHLDVVLAVFPDAKIIQTHRDPAKTAGSFSSMVAHGYGVFSDEVDTHEVAGHWHRNNADMVKAAMRVRACSPASFLDVSYYDLLQDPMAPVRRIYEFAGLALTPQALAAMDDSRKRNVQNRHGVHRYRLEDFGLSKAQIHRDYAAYREHFQIPEEGSGA